MSDIPPAIRRARAQWQFTGKARPGFAVEPRQGQESVWDYPRPPRVERDQRRVQVIVDSVTVADSRRAQRVLETASPPTFYIPPDDVHFELLESTPGSSRCEWKGQARYWSIRVGDTFIKEAGWSYPSPFEGFALIANHVAFYPAKVECWVADDIVRPQPGGFYGGWVTPELVGPFKGAPGTQGW
jgi:uncharacterized protein (DUF427 family)